MTTYFDSQTEPESYWASVQDPSIDYRRAPNILGEAQRAQILSAGKRFAERATQEENARSDDKHTVEPPVWLFIAGQLGAHAATSTEDQVRERLCAALGQPEENKVPRRQINILLDSPGGDLDSAFKIVIFTARYAKRLSVYVPRRAKSAATLIAVGADEIHISPFGELGPLDTQIADPRNPTTTISALDCYQSMSYVRSFGFDAFSSVLVRLVHETEGRVPLNDLLVTASSYAIGSITPMLQTVKALDFGGWGRRLRIGQRYAEELLRAKNPDTKRANRIADRLVYGYTHHQFPINDREAIDIGLPVRTMNVELYEPAMQVIELCRAMRYVGVISGSKDGVESQGATVSEATTPEGVGSRDSVIGSRGPDSAQALMPVDMDKHDEPKTHTKKRKTRV